MGKKATGKFANLIDHRYVFFTSLSDHGALYEHLEDRGKGYVSELQSKIGKEKAKEELEQQVQGTIPQYIDFMYNLAQSARANEISFIQSQKDKDLPEEIQKRLDAFLNTISNDSGNAFIGAKDYSDVLQDFLQVINLLVHQNEKNQTEMLQSFIQMLQATTTEVNNIKESSDTTKLTYKEIEDTFKRSKKEYIDLMRRRVMAGKDFKSIGTNLYAQKIQGVLGNLRKDKKFVAELEDTFNKNGIEKGMQGAYLISFITDFVVDQSLEAVKGTPPKQLLANFKEMYKKEGLDSKIQNAQKQYIDSFFNQFSSDLKNIEKLAFDRKGAGREFTRMTEESQKKFIEQYRNLIGNTSDLVQLEKLLDEVRNGKEITSNTYRQFTIRINRIIKEAFENRPSFEEALSESDWAELRQQEVMRELDINLKNQLDIDMKGYTLAEIFADKDLLDNLMAQIFQGGTKVKLRDDVTFLIGIKDFKFLNDSSAADEVLDIFSSFPEMVERGMHKELENDSADIKKQEKVYLDALKKTRSRLENLVKEGKISEEEKSKILNKFKDSFFGGISVKNYMFTANQFGFHGGSLGKNAEKIVENITEMYELGGISKDDMEYIYFGVANCGEDGIANGLETDIASFLLGAAAIIMFDTGFTQTQGFLQKVTQALGEDSSSPKTLNLFQLNYGIVPASIVYETIYYNLRLIYQDITTQKLPKFMNITANQVVIENNITEEKDKPPFDKEKAKHNENYLLDRWKAVADVARKPDKVKISFTFMAGILDVLKNIGEAFGIN